jgi:diadenosine tetraphosphate (Ap4A) HIT family hydrolase
MNPTIEKFGYPATLIREYEHWLVLLRPAQVTLGSLVLASRSNAAAFSELPRDAFCEQHDAITAIEAALRRFVAYDRINYLMLMMVDREVHFHVVPRYAEPRRWKGREYPDSGWPGAPRLDCATTLNPEQLAELATQIVSNFR